MTFRRAFARTLWVAAKWAAVTAALVGIDLLARAAHLIPGVDWWRAALGAGVCAAAGLAIHTHDKETSR